MCSFVKVVSPIDVFGREDTDEPLQIHSLERDQHQVSGVVHVHGTLRVDDTVSGLRPHVLLKAFGWALIYPDKMI